MTSKLQVTIPKAIADQYAIRPGDELEWLPASDAIRVIPSRRRRAVSAPAGRLRLFDQATERQRKREAQERPRSPATDRGWRRDELYGRGGTG